MSKVYQLVMFEGTGKDWMRFRRAHREGVIDVRGMKLEQTFDPLEMDFRVEVWIATSDIPKLEEALSDGKQARMAKAFKDCNPAEMQRIAAEEDA